MYVALDLPAFLESSIDLSQVAVSRFAGSGVFGVPYNATL